MTRELQQTLWNDAQANGYKAFGVEFDDQPNVTEVQFWPGVAAFLKSFGSFDQVPAETEIHLTKLKERTVTEGPIGNDKYKWSELGDAKHKLVNRATAPPPDRVLTRRQQRPPWGRRRGF